MTSTLLPPPLPRRRLPHYLLQQISSWCLSNQLPTPPSATSFHQQPPLFSPQKSPPPPFIPVTRFRSETGSWNRPPGRTFNPCRPPLNPVDPPSSTVSGLDSPTLSSISLLKSAIACSGVLQSQLPPTSDYNKKGNQVNCTTPKSGIRFDFSPICRNNKPIELIIRIRIQILLLLFLYNL